MKQLKLFEMDEIPFFPPNLKPGRKTGRLERVFTCPQCDAILFLSYDVDEIVHGIFRGWSNPKKSCYHWACQHCKHKFVLMSSRSKCEICKDRADCLLHGTAEIITRKVYKPYSTIKPKRSTVWE
jgi:hypothetical protein